jgi:hypothetical protein
MMSGRKQYMALRRMWLTKAVGGLLMFGFGICLVGEAIIAKSEHEPWFGLGTIALVVTNAGLSIFVSAAIDRIRMLDLRG